MHPIGDIADGILGRRELAPVVGHQLRRDDTVQAADAVDMPRAGQREARHVEQARRGRRARERQERVDPDAEFADEIAEVREHQLVAERIVAGRDRRVRRECALAGNRLDGGGQLEPASAQFAQQLERQERGMAFVHVPDGGRESERAQCTHAADAENHFLTDAYRLIAAIQTMRDVTIGWRILRHVGVEQHDANASHERLPQARNHIPASHLHGHGDPRAVGGSDRLYRQIARIVITIARVLHAIAVHALREISLAVQQTDRDEIQPLVARGLAVIAGEHAETAGVDREALVEAVLGAEVRDKLRALERWRIQIRIEAAEHIAIAREIRRIPGRAIERLLTNAAQQQFWIAADLAPQRWVQLLEQRPRRAIPAEIQVAGQFRQASQRGGNLRRDFDRQGLGEVLVQVRGHRAGSLAADLAPDVPSDLTVRSQY